MGVNYGANKVASCACAVGSNATGRQLLGGEDAPVAKGDDGVVFEGRRAKLGRGQCVFRY